ncbi:MAG: Crp/Fnr family transcriptional regulator [Acidimicrobiales bacterium]|nr:Crp/Fnr family transcriptional regulator [Acidimicrobiales bacterium]
MAIAPTTTSPPDTELVNWLAGCLGRGDLAPLSCEDVEEFASHVTEDRYAGGTVIYARDALPERVHIVRDGMVELTRELGGRTAVVQLLRSGSVFGDVPLFLRTGEPTEARAVHDSVVVSIDSVTLFGLLGRRPMLARRWLVSLAGRMAGMQDRVSDLLAGSLDRQVASWLLREAVADDGVTVSQATLARLLGARRTSVNQSLRRLEADGFVETGYRRIRLVDGAGLAAMLAAG